MNNKIIIIIALLGFQVLSLNAQETDVAKKDEAAHKERNTELGILGQSFHGSEQFSGQVLMGLQFKRWIKPNVAFRILAAYNPYNYYPKPYVAERYSADSLRVRYNNINVDRFALGFGMEVQRQFYKRVFFFAGLELLAGYGEGKTTSYSRIVPVENMYYAYLGNVDQDYEVTYYRRSYVRLIPGVGAKIVFKKINFGLETQFASMGIESERAGAKKYTIPDMDILGNIAYRFHVNYSL